MKTRSITLSLIAAATIAGLSVAPAMAQHPNTPGIDNAQQDIHARIQQGIASGQITRATYSSASATSRCARRA